MSEEREQERTQDPWSAPKGSRWGGAPVAAADERRAAADDERWAREALERLAREALVEQRRARRWNVFFRFAFLIYALVFLVLLLPRPEQPLVDGEHTALIEIKGVIAPDSEANADDIVAGLRAAYRHEGTRGIVLRINSPGGSPVQAAKVYREIRRLKAEHPDIPVIAVAEELCASAAYYMAVAADKIYADGSSLVGSIGVLANGFGFVGTMEKLGVERRLFTAGEHKGFFDPFSPLKEEETRHMQRLLQDTYEQFVAAVKAGRGERLADDPEIFSGLVWTGRQAKALGLVDELGSVGEVAREVIGAERVVDFTPREDYWERLARRLGAAIGDRLLEAIWMPGLR